jgi:hypothetical protein
MREPSGLQTNFLQTARPSLEQVSWLQARDGQLQTNKSKRLSVRTRKILKYSWQGDIDSSRTYIALRLLSFILIADTICDSLVLLYNCHNSGHYPSPRSRKPRIWTWGSVALTTRHYPQKLALIRRQTAIARYNSLAD